MNLRHFVVHVSSTASSRLYDPHFVQARKHFLQLSVVTDNCIYTTRNVEITGVERKLKTVHTFGASSVLSVFRYLQLLEWVTLTSAWSIMDVAYVWP